MLFLFVWAKLQREKRLGYGADYCPVCRRVRAFEVAETRKAVHFWFVPLERGDFLGYQQTCRTCRVVASCNLGQFTRLSRSARIALPALVEMTFPKISEVYAERLALEQKVAAGGDALDATTRKKLLMEVFAMAEPHFRFGYGHEGRRILALALRPLWPTESEIRACLEHYRTAGRRMGAKLSTEGVMVSIYPESEIKKPGSYSY